MPWLNAVAAFACALALSISAADAKPRKQKQAYTDSTSLIYCVSDQTYRQVCGGPVYRTSEPRRGRVTGRRKVQPAQVSFVSSGLVSSARRYIGMNARQIGLKRYTLWCSAFMRFIAGSPPGVDDWAISWARAGLSRGNGSVGDIAIVRSRRIHVGVVSGIDANGNPIIISGNHNNRVAESAYPKSSVIAYVRL